MKSSEIKISLIQKIDSLNAASLKEFYGILLNYINEKKTVDEWVGVSEEEKKAIEDGLAQLDRGERIPRKEVTERVRKKIRR